MTTRKNEQKGGDDVKHIKSRQGMEDAKLHYSVYAEHNKVLRLWLVGYGVGAPVLLLNNRVIWDTIISGTLRFDVILLFASGVFVQVVLAFLNKYTQWGIYAGAANSEFKKTPQYKLCDKVSEWIGIDFVCDLLTIGLFVVGTAFVLSAFTK